MLHLTDKLKLHLKPSHYVSAFKGIISYAASIVYCSESKTSAFQFGSLINSCGSLGAWHSTDDSILLNITSPLFGFPFHLENTTHCCQPRFQRKQIKLTINQPASHSGSLSSVIISAVYLTTEEFVTKQEGERTTAAAAARAQFRDSHLCCSTNESRTYMEKYSWFTNLHIKCAATSNEWEQTPEDGSVSEFNGI